MSLSYTCPTIQLEVRPYQRQNDATWYPIQIKLFNHSYELEYRFSEFVQFSRAMQQRFNIEHLEPINPTLKSWFLSIILKKKNSTENNNQKYIDRQLQLEKFCAQLVLLPSHITCSHLFLSFFSASKQQSHMMMNNNNNTIKKVFCSTKSKKHDLHHISNRLSRQSITSSNSSNSSSSCSDSSTMTVISSNRSSTLLVDEIKVKIIYDCHNIIIIRVARAISLDQLRSQVIQKFALLRIPLPDQLAFFDITDSAPFHGSEYDGMISDKYQLRVVMQQKWACLQKVTLQCII